MIQKKDSLVHKGTATKSSPISFQATPNEPTIDPCFSITYLWASSAPSRATLAATR